MPKLKRFRNPHKSAPQPQPVTSPTRDPTYCEPTFKHPNIDVLDVHNMPTSNVPDIGNITPNMSTTNVSEDNETPTLYVGRESAHCWTIETIGIYIFYFIIIII